jgi:hypothetical protein|tara:strand:+ start:242 stop:757 length:516 start_codon:yes stop_codon:yes gene_type:complete
MSIQLQCEKRVTTKEEHQFWMDSTVEYIGLKDYAKPRMRFFHALVTQDQLKNTTLLEQCNLLDINMFVGYYPLSKIVHWGGWSMSGISNETYTTVSMKSKSKNSLIKQLNDFDNVKKDPQQANIILDYFDENSFWYWDCYGSGFSSKTKMETVYNLTTKKSTYSPMIRETA